MVDLEGEPVAPDLALGLIPDGLPRGSTQRIELAGAGLACAGGIAGDPIRPLLACRNGQVAVVADRRLESPDADWGDWLLRAYERWTFDLPRHLSGAYALGLWDAPRRTLLLARDSIGERTLYFRSDGRRAAFASEAESLSRFDGAAARPHRLRLLSFLCGGNPDPTWTFFAGVSRLPEGGRLLLTPHGPSQTRAPSWTAGVPATLSAEEAALELPRRLRMAVDRRRARAGEQGVLLSGGLDSVTVACESAESLEGEGRSLYAFTWASRSGDAIDERRSSGLLVSHRPNIVEHPLEAEELWPLSRYPEAYRDANDPVSATYPDLLLTTLEAAREAGVTVLFNGIGGDPVVGWRVPEIALLLQLRFGALWERLRRSGWRALLRRQLAGRRRPPLPDWFCGEARRLARDAGLLETRLPLATLASSRAFRRWALEHPANAMHLERFDRLSRRLRIRVACPWHDRDLAELALGSPDCALSSREPMKTLVRSAYRQRLPAGLLEAPTKAAGGPSSSLRQRGLFELGRPVVEQLLGASRLAELGLIDARLLLQRYRNASFRRDIIPHLWEVVTAEAWLRSQDP